ncbi:MAG TPA: hypothetical protein VMV01_16745, partial [Planctomycetota bacterium]|nr:hypothetical protein [Planctomycetota bacterium]
GRLLDPTPLAAAVYDREAARASLDAADREYRRVQTLQRGNSNASQRDLEAARAAFEREQANARSAAARLTAVWGGWAERRADLPALAAQLVGRDAAIARLDLPLGTRVTATPSAARVAAPADPSAAAVAATVLGAAPDADPTVQGQGMLLLLDRPVWPSGTALEGWLTLSGEPRTGVEVPGSALLRSAGRTIVYVQTGEDSFVQRAVELLHPTADGWFVTSGLAPGERLVVRGAPLLLSEQQLAAAPDADEAD